MNIKKVEIDGRLIGPGEPVYVIAEMSGNHNGDINRALKILEAAKLSGADAVKLQTYRPDTITIKHDSPEFFIKGGIWNGLNTYDLYEEAHTPWEWHSTIFNRAKELGITVFSAPFDPTAIEFLEQLDCPAYKIASPEIVDLPLIEQVARTGKPMIISTGMATLEEIQEAIDAATNAGAVDIIILHCVSAYPAPLEDINLSTIRELEKRFKLPIGLSDHTLNTFVASLSVGFGACVIEKHVTLRRSDGGVDSSFSIEPEELEVLVADVKRAFLARGLPTFRPSDSEQSVLMHRRSLYVIQDVKKGEILTKYNVRSIRPAMGIKPKYYHEIIGKKAKRNLKYGEPFQIDMAE